MPTSRLPLSSSQEARSLPTAIVIGIPRLSNTYLKLLAVVRLHPSINLMSEGVGGGSSGSVDQPAALIPMEETVEALIVYLVAPLLPARASFHPPPTIDQQKAVAKQSPSLFKTMYVIALTLCRLLRFVLFLGRKLRA